MRYCVLVPVVVCVLVCEFVSLPVATWLCGVYGLQCGVV